MHVTAHAIARISDRVGSLAAEGIVARLEAMPGEPGSIAIEVIREQPFGRRRPPVGGDQVIVIARDGSIETVMLRRSWNQPFTPRALGVDRIIRWRNQ